MADDWAPGSWRAFEAKQQPKYADKAALDAVLAQGEAAALTQRRGQH